MFPFFGFCQNQLLARFRRTSAPLMTSIRRGVSLTASRLDRHPSWRVPARKEKVAYFPLPLWETAVWQQLDRQKGPRLEGSAIRFFSLKVWMKAPSFRHAYHQKRFPGMPDSVRYDFSTLFGSLVVSFFKKKGNRGTEDKIRFETGADATGAPSMSAVAVLVLLVVRTSCFRSASCKAIGEHPPLATTHHRSISEVLSTDDIKTSSWPVQSDMLNNGNLSATSSFRWALAVCPLT
mmetsp:Transcript_292/g.759  ORF Transcript_292/g.759 Transcript_292/m.759 type:complete len:235 (+) Transcript_292:457-1161(+)